jgi:chromosome segregation ATPase
MDEQTVRDAVAQLQAQGAAPTVRKVHRLVGGSFRDIGRYLKMQTLLPREEAAVVTPEPARALPRPVGEIAEAQECFREAHAYEGEIRRQYQAALTRLRTLREAATPPQDLRPYEREAQEFNARLHERERAVQQAEHRLRELKDRAGMLARRLPGLRQRLALAQVEAQAAQQEAARLITGAQERLAGWAREIEQAQAELARLAGNLHT